jgi:hypothetical protein
MTGEMQCVTQGQLLVLGWPVPAQVSATLSGRAHPLPFPCQWESSVLKGTLHVVQQLIAGTSVEQLFRG